MLRVLRVSGSSLQPTYQDGDFVLVSKIPILLYGVHTGDVIAFRHPVYGTLLKEVVHIGSGKEIYVLGTHEASVDSRSFGPVGLEAVVGKVVWHIRRPRSGALSKW